jgi:hypothetical protein
MNKIFEIVEAWSTAINPSEVRRKVAEIRYGICFDCEFKGTNFLNNEVCTACGCPLKGKIFTSATPEQNNCPKGKWPV